MVDIGSLIDSTVDSVQDIASSAGVKTVDASGFVVDKASDGIGYMKKGIAKLWNGVTVTIAGRADFEKAAKLYGLIEKRYNDAKANYENEVNAASEKIEAKINLINYHKTDIYQNHFARFTNLANQVHNLRIDGTSFLEYFDGSILEIKTTSGIRAKMELFKIDFDNLKFKEILLGFLTFGYSMRKLASETLCEVKSEKKRVHEEIQKMKSQISKIKVTLESIENVAEYFSILISNYDKLLSRFEYGIKSQVQKNILKGVELVDGKLDFKLMPIAHIEEFQALFNLSVVLKQMATMGYLTDEGELKKDDLEAVDHIQALVGNTQLLAA